MKCLSAALVAVLMLPAFALAQTTYTQATTNNFATWTNLVEKSATIAPNVTATFSNLVKEAWTTNSGGVFDFPTSVATGTTLYRGTYAGGAKRLHMTSNGSMQNATAGGGTFTPISTPNLTTTSTNSSDYTLTIGPIYDVASSNIIITEAVYAVGFVVLSRTAAAYPLDLRVTVTFNDNSTDSAIATIGNPRATDDTFYGFTAPDNLSITQVRFQSFAVGTTTPVADRIGFDDFGFVTRAAFIPPPPIVENISPANFAVVAATNGIQFNVRAYAYLDPTNITATLNTSNITSGLNITGNSTNRFVTYSNLAPDVGYTLIINATNSTGSVTVTQNFYTFTSPFVLYDSHGFSNDTLYPLGPLMNVTDGLATWTPNAAEPAQIVDVGDPWGKVLQRQDTGLSRADFLDFPPVSAGVLTVEFDALASITTARTMDICLQPLNAGGTIMGPFLAWGEPANKLGYFDNVNWLPVTDLQSGWHHYKIYNYLSGPAAGRYDVLVDDVLVAQKLPWRNAPAGSALSRFRIQSQNTSQIFEHGDIDNLVISAGPPDLNVVLSPTVLNVTPADHAIIHPSAGFSFEVTSAEAIGSTNVSLTLNGVPVSLTVTNSQTNHLYASYTGLTIGNYGAQITAFNSAGTTTVSLAFISTDEAWMLHPGDNWGAPWQWTTGQPQLLTADPIDGSTPYLRLDLTNVTARNFMRQYTNGTVDINKAHYIRWKCRVPDTDFVGNFTAFNDRVHFFGRTAPRLTAGTDANNNWAISATGAEQTPGSGVSAGQIFYIFDNLDGSGNYNLNNLVSSGIPILPAHVYSFQVLLRPESKTYLAKIVDETSSLTFTSSVPHHFRDVTSTNFPFLHFGVQTAAAATPRPFDLDSVSIVQAAAQVTLLNPVRAGANFSFSFASVGGNTHVAQYSTSLTNPSWTNLQTIPGDGTIKTVTHTNAPADSAFYRVQSSSP
jgi:hypothetical protein